MQHEYTSYAIVLKLVTYNQRPKKSDLIEFFQKKLNHYIKPNA